MIKPLFSLGQTLTPKGHTMDWPHSHQSPARLPSSATFRRSQNCPFGDETVFVNDTVLTAVDKSRPNPLPDQEAPTDTAFHRARYSWA